MHGPLDPTEREQLVALVADGVEAKKALVSANLRLVERLTRVDADTLLYEFTVEDPKTWTKPWTAAIPMKKVNTPIYEYACHEGNYALANILRGARLQESKEPTR